MCFPIQLGAALLVSQPIGLVSRLTTTKTHLPRDKTQESSLPDRKYLSASSSLSLSLSLSFSLSHVFLASVSQSVGVVCQEGQWHRRLPSLLSRASLRPASPKWTSRSHTAVHVRSFVRSSVHASLTPLPSFLLFPRTFWPWCVGQGTTFAC